MEISAADGNGISADLDLCAESLYGIKRCIRVLAEQRGLHAGRAFCKGGEHVCPVGVAFGRRSVY